MKKYLLLVLSLLLMISVVGCVKEEIVLHHPKIEVLKADEHNISIKTNNSDFIEGEDGGHAGLTITNTGDEIIREISADIRVYDKNNQQISTSKRDYLILNALDPGMSTTSVITYNVYDNDIPHKIILEITKIEI